MIAIDPKFAQRLVAWQVLFGVGTGTLAAVAVPRLLLFTSEQAYPTSAGVFWVVSLSSLVPALRTLLVLHRFRYVLRSLTLGSRSIEPWDLEAWIGEVRGITLTWVVTALAALALFVFWWRPFTLDSSTTASVAILTAVVVAGASLPLHVLVRRSFVAVLELADPGVMREVVALAEQRGVTQRRVAWRLLAALGTPVAFVGLGSALIAGAHVRRADEREREETARAVARAALDLGPGVVANAGLDEAIAEAARHGFDARVEPEPGEYSLVRLPPGIVELSTPLDAGRARVTFNASTVPVVSLGAFLVALVSTALAAMAGVVLARALTRDLRNATVGVRGLSEHTSGPRLGQVARFRVVAELGAAIEQLAARFRVFARAQRHAIRAREAATKMRGLFFASVSHDLKSPLNAILGFTELVRQSEALTDDQSESLEQIERSGRELLALIETVLDAARVEAGQLSLVREPVDLAELVGLAAAVGRDLGPQDAPAVAVDIVPGSLTAWVDRVRMARALAAFIGQALRSAGAEPLHIRAHPADGVYVEVVITVRRAASKTGELAALFDPLSAAAATEPRGLALALGVAQSVVELHAGSIRVVRIKRDATRILVRLPAEYIPP